MSGPVRSQTLALRELFMLAARIAMTRLAAATTPTVSQPPTSVNSAPPARVLNAMSATQHAPPPLATFSSAGPGPGSAFTFSAHFAMAAARIGSTTAASGPTGSSKLQAGAGENVSGTKRRASNTSGTN